MAKKTYRIDPQIETDSDSYDRDIIEKYLDYLQETDNAIEVGNVVFDVEQLVRRKFVCDTRLCLKKTNGYFSKRRSCCTEYSVRVSSDERDVIEDFMPKIRKHYPDIGEAIDVAGDFAEFDDWFDRVIRKKSDGTCMFLSDQGGGIFHCAIHGAALKEKESPFEQKPSACTLFPLCYLEHDGGIILTAYSLQNARVIEEENEPIPYDCCEPNPLAEKPLYIEMAKTIQDLLGKECYDRFVKKIKKRGLDKEASE